MNGNVPPSPVAKKPGAASWRRRLPLIGGILLVVLIVIGLWPRAVPVEMAAVTRGPMVVTVDEEGMTRIRNRYLVSSPVAGQLRRIDWKAGAAVEAGKTVLAVLETSGADLLDARSQAQAEARVRAAEANREMAAANHARAAAAHALAATEFERHRVLAEKKTISKQEFDMASMRAIAGAQEERAALFALKIAEFELEQARALLTRGRAGEGGDAEPLVIVSPVSGRILRVFQESARVVPGGFALMEVGDPADLEVRIEVLSRDAVAVVAGARVILEQWGGAERLEARVRLVEPSAFTKISALGVEEQRVYVMADFVDPLGKRSALGDSYRVEARIVTWEGANVLRAPAGALFQREGGWHAFSVEGSRARLRKVEVGHSNGVETEVLGGIAEGESFIVYPGDKVQDRTRVTPMRIESM